MRLIDADTIKKDLEYQMDRSNPDWSWTNEAACYDLLEYLDSIPVVDTVKRGEWLQHEYAGGFWFRCSVCRDVYLLPKKYNFCPNCGADMRGENND